MEVAVMMWLIAGLSSLALLLSSDADTKWLQFKERLESGDTTLDFTAARMAYSEACMYSSFDSKEQDAESAMEDHFAKGELAVACSVGRQALEQNPLHPSLNGSMAFLYKKRNMVDSFQHYRWRYVGVLESIDASGPGTSADSAKVVIAVYEEYALLDYLRLSVISQSLVRTKSGSSVDVMQCIDAGGDTVNLSFNVDISMNAMMRRLKRD